MDDEFLQALYHPKRIRTCNNEFICSLCGQNKNGFAISAFPIKSGPHTQCCDDCYKSIVIPASIEYQRELHNRLLNIYKNRKEYQENAKHGFKSESDYNQ